MSQQFLRGSGKCEFNAIDKLELLLKQRIEGKTGFGDAHAQARCAFVSVRGMILSDDKTLNLTSFRQLFSKLNFPNDSAVDALFYRYDIRGTGCISLKDFSERLCGLQRVPLAPTVHRDSLIAVRLGLAQRGECAFRIFTQMVTVGGPALSAEQLSSLLGEFGVNRSIVEDACRCFRSGRDGAIDSVELIVALRVPLSDARLTLAKQLCVRLRRSIVDTLLLSDVMQQYLPAKHPEVRRATLTISGAQSQFDACWSSFSPDAALTDKDIIDYLADIGTCVGYDAYFELLIRQVWAVFPIADAAETPVAVVHFDGTQDREAIIALGDTSQETIMKRLHRQGVTNIMRAKVIS